jgi:hypothetical protein
MTRPTPHEHILSIVHSKRTDTTRPGGASSPQPADLRPASNTSRANATHKSTPR